METPASDQDRLYAAMREPRRDAVLAIKHKRLFIYLVVAPLLFALLFIVLATPDNFADLAGEAVFAWIIGQWISLAMMYRATMSPRDTYAEQKA